MSYRDGHIVRIVDLLCLLIKAPRTKPELLELTELTQTSVSRWVSALEAEGLIEMTPGVKRGKAAVFCWVLGRAAQTAGEGV